MGSLHAGLYFGAASGALFLLGCVLGCWLEHRSARKLEPERTVSPDGGLGKRSVFTVTKAPGTRTPATATTAGCSSFSLRGIRLEGEDALILHRPQSSSGAPGLSGVATVAHGGSGEQLGSVA